MNKKRSDGSLCPGPGHATSCPCGRGCEEPELIACASCGPDQCEDCVIESLRTELAGKEKAWEQAFAHELELIKSDKVLRAELTAQKEISDEAGKALRDMRTALNLIPINDDDTEIEKVRSIALDAPMARAEKGEGKCTEN